MHLAAASGRLNVLKDFSDLGASVNYHDGKGLTPLYHSIVNGTAVGVCRYLLASGAVLGVSDIHGSEEVHQACKSGLYLHLEVRNPTVIFRS